MKSMPTPQTPQLLTWQGCTFQIYNFPHIKPLPSHYFKDFTQSFNDISIHFEQFSLPNSFRLLLLHFKNRAEAYLEVP